MVLFKKQSAKDIKNSKNSRPPLSAPGSTLSARSAYEASKKQQLNPPAAPSQSNTASQNGGFLARSEQDRYPSVAPPSGSNNDAKDEDDDDEDQGPSPADMKGVGPDGAIYTIFTSPNHAPRPDHLPTLIVTAFSMPGVRQEILYTYLHTNYNSEQYLLTPSEKGDLCVARMLPPSFSKIEKKKDKEHLPIVCEGSRRLKWKITDTGRYQSTYLVTVPPPKKDDGPDKPLFKISKVNPQSPFWTMSYFVKSGHDISPVAVPFGKIQKNLPKYGGGTRVTIYGRTAQERKVWSTLGDENPDMVEWVVISAALSVLDDEIIKATQAAEGLRGLQRLRPDVRRTASSDPIEKGGKIYRIDTTKPSNPRRRRNADEDPVSSPSGPPPPSMGLPGPPSAHGPPLPGPLPQGAPMRAPTTHGPPPPGARQPGPPGPVPNGRPLYPPYTNIAGGGPPTSSPGRIVTNGPGGYVGPRSAPVEGYGSGGLPGVPPASMNRSNSSAPTRNAPLPIPGTGGPDRSGAPSAPPVMEEQRLRLPIPGSLSRKARTPGPTEGGSDRPPLPNPYGQQSSPAPSSQSKGPRAPLHNPYYMPDPASNMAAPSQSTYVSGSRPPVR